MSFGLGRELFPDTHHGIGTSRTGVMEHWSGGEPGFTTPILHSSNTPLSTVLNESVGLREVVDSQYLACGMAQGWSIRLSETILHGTMRSAVWSNGAWKTAPRRVLQRGAGASARAQFLECHVEEDDRQQQKRGDDGGDANSSRLKPECLRLEHGSRPFGRWGVAKWQHIRVGLPPHRKIVVAHTVRQEQWAGVES